MKRFVHDRSTVDMLHAFQKKLEEAKQSEEVESSTYIDDEDESLWELVARKQVQDSDGFYTDYTLWFNILTEEWVTVFGDKDLYTPDSAIPDMEFGTDEVEAREWFDNYSTEEYY